MMRHTIDADFFSALPNEIIDRNIFPYSCDQAILSFGKTCKKNNIFLNTKYYRSRYHFFNQQKRQINIPSSIDECKDYILSKDLSNCQDLGMYMGAGVGLFCAIVGSVPGGVFGYLLGSAIGLGHAYATIYHRNFLEIQELKNICIYLDCCRQLSKSTKKIIIDSISKKYHDAQTYSRSYSSMNLKYDLMYSSLSIAEKWKSIENYMIGWNASRKQNQSSVLTNNGKKLFCIIHDEIKQWVSPEVLGVLEEEPVNQTMNKPF